MTLPIAYRPEVQEEIDAAYRHYETQREGLGGEFLVSLRNQLDLIRENPEMYAVLYRSVRASLMRRFPYVVYFRMEASRILVIAIQHGHRHPRRWRERV